MKTFRENKPFNTTGPSMTKKAFKDEVDINNITKRYLNTGMLPQQNGMQPIFGDFSSVDFQDMQNAVADINMQFATLPARLRSRFMNDPYHLIRFVEDPKNREEALKLGLLVPVDMEHLEALDKAAETPESAPAAKADPEANPVPIKGGTRLAGSKAE